MSGLPGDDTAPLVQSWGVTREASDAEKAAAARFTARHALDAEDLRVLLEVMGLL